MKKIILLLLILIYCILPIINSAAVNSPDDPEEPVVTDLSDGHKNNKDLVQFQYQSGLFGRAQLSINKRGSFKIMLDPDNRIAKRIKLSTVKNIRITGYTMQKKTTDNLSIVFYFPYSFEIELNNGDIIKDAKGRISELESFYAETTDGKKKLYTYFIRYWLEDKAMFTDNLSSDYNETPIVPDTAIIYLEFAK